MAKTIDELNVAKRIASGVSPGTIRTAGRIEFVRDQGPLRRDIRVDGFKWNRTALKNLTKILWAAQRAHSYSVSAYRLLSRMPSSEFSPDGLLGGRGYIQNIKELRNQLASSSDILSNFTDTMYDEVNADHWNPATTVESKKLINEAKDAKANPERFVETEYRSEGTTDQFMSPEQMNPQPQDFGMPEVEKDDEEPAEAVNRQATTRYDLSRETRFDRTSLRENSTAKFDKALQRLLNTHSARKAAALYNTDPSTESAPRVDHIGPGMGGEYGWYNDDATPSDDPGMTGFYQSAPIYEDGNEDGVTGQDNPTDGDVTFLKTASNDKYSWLPGSDNSLVMPYYDRDVSPQEMDSMRKRSAPPNPMTPKAASRPDTSWLWSDLDA